MKRLITTLLLLASPIATQSNSIAAPSNLAVEKPFKVLGQWLDRNDDSILKDAGPDNIARAFKVISSTNQALKTMDGAAHGLYAYSHGRPNVKEWSRIEYSRATKAEKEERLKAFRKAKLLEEAVYSSELAELTAIGIDHDDSLQYAEALQSKHDVILEDFEINQGKFRFMLVVDHDSQRLTISIGDAVEWDEKLDIIRAPPLAVNLRSRGLVKRSLNVNPQLWEATLSIVGKVRQKLAELIKTYPNYGVHLTGFSLGGGVAALVAGVLDGAIHVTDIPQLNNGTVGMVRHNVTTFIFAPPPCISKGIRGLHSFTTSFVCGDDMIPRSTHTSLQRLEKRLIDYVHSKSNSNGGIVFDYAKSWMKGVVGATLSQVVTHQATKKEEEEDEDSLTLPGRVYYIKPRKLHGGATIKEVLRGNLREDLLWQIHDVFVSKSMLKHHSLHKYVSTLARIPLQ